MLIAPIEAGDQMNKMILPAAVLLAAVLVAAAPASAEIKAGDQFVTVEGGILAPEGAQQEFFYPGYLAGGEYLYTACPYFSVGAEALYEKPHNVGQGVLFNGHQTTTQYDYQSMTSLAALGRFNFTPQKDWTPYAQLGLGMYYNNDQAVVGVAGAPQFNFTGQAYFWRITAIAAAGLDYVNADGLLLGVQLHYQTFGQNLEGLGALVRVGLRFGR
jgi:hypothetical protein